MESRRSSCGGVIMSPLILDLFPILHFFFFSCSNDSCHVWIEN